MTGNDTREWLPLSEFARRQPSPDLEERLLHLTSIGEVWVSEPGPRYRVSHPLHVVALTGPIYGNIPPSRIELDQRCKELLQMTGTRVETAQEWLDVLTGKLPHSGPAPFVPPPPWWARPLVAWRRWRRAGRHRGGG